MTYILITTNTHITYFDHSSFKVSSSYTSHTYIGYQKTLEKQRAHKKKKIEI